MFKKRFIASYAAIAVLAGGGIYYTVENADASPKKSHAVTVESKPVSLVGNWHQTKGMPGVTMRAEISGDGIQVNMQFDRANEGGIFWMGSFDTSDQKTQKFTVTSLPDPDARNTMGRSLFASSEKTKKFAYDNGDLSFEFSMMGVESTVHLSR